MALKWLLLLHSVYYRAFGYSSSNDEQSKVRVGCDKFGGADHEGGVFVKKPKDEMMMIMKGGGYNYFQMPLHYPRYKKADYEKMEEWKVDMLLNEYGLSYKGTLEEKRSFAMGAFLWPDEI